VEVNLPYQMKVDEGKAEGVYVQRGGMCVYIYIYIYTHTHTSSNDWTVRGSKPGRSRRFSRLQNCPDWFWGSLSFLFDEYWSSLLGVEQAGHEVDQSPVSWCQDKE
jgi:hypothetical protein